MPLDETVPGSIPPKYRFQTGWMYSNFDSIVLTPLVNRLVTPVGAMRSSMLNVWMMTLKEARLVGVLRGDVSAVDSASGAGLRVHHFYTQSR